MGVAIRMTRWLMPSIVAVSLSGVLSAMLNAYHRFRATALVGVGVNVVTIAAVLAFNQRLGIYALVLGTALGLTAQLLVQLPSFLAIGKYRLTIDLHHPGLRQNLGPARADHRRLGGRTDRAVFRPVLRLDAFPGIYRGHELRRKAGELSAADFRGGDRDGDLSAAGGAIRARQPPRRSTQPRDRASAGELHHDSVAARADRAGSPDGADALRAWDFQAGATDLTAALLPYAAVGLLALAANVVLTRCCFACKETAWPVTISVVTVVVNVLLSLVWLPTLGARGLLLANSLSQTMQAVLLLMLTARLVPAIDWRALLVPTAKIAVSSLAMFLALKWIEALGVMPDASLASRAWFLFGQLAIGGAVFLAVARILNVEELELARRTILAKFERNLVTPPESREAPIA